MASLTARLVKSFEKFIKRDPYGHHDKLIKRYLGLFSELKTDIAMGYCLSKFESEPALRDTIYRYFSALGPSKRILTALTAYLTGDDVLDDASLCQTAKLITDWEIDPGSSIFVDIKGLIDKLSDTDRIEGDPYRFLSALWLISKYSAQARLRRYLEDNEETWKHSEFLSRQVAATACKFRNPSYFNWLVKKIERHSFRSPLSVLTSIETIKSYSNVIPADVRLYILNGNSKGTYSLQRFLVAMAVLSSKTLSSETKDHLKVALLKVLQDPHYVRVVGAI
jgi:hypothetical protein